MLAAGGAAALLGQMAFSHALDGPSLPLPDLGEVFDVEEAAAVQSVPSVAPPAAQVEPIAAIPVQSVGEHDGFGLVPLAEQTEQADVASLVKAAGLAEAAETKRRAEEAAARAQAALAADKPSARLQGCAPSLAGLAGVKSWVLEAGKVLRCSFGVQTIGGIGSRANASDHPSGLALDLMVNRATGDKVADYALKYRGDLKINYVIWRQRINFGSGWQAMEDRGSATANHNDHVHISFDRR